MIDKIKMNYKITTDFSKVKKEKCDTCKGRKIVLSYWHPEKDYPLETDCSTCSGTGNKPIKITYEAGECDACGGRGKIDLEIPYSFKTKTINCLRCKNKLHPKIGDTFDSCNICGKVLEDGELRTDTCGHDDWSTRKFLSINTKKEEAVVVQIG